MGMYRPRIALQYRHSQDLVAHHEGLAGLPVHRRVGLGPGGRGVDLEILAHQGIDLAQRKPRSWDEESGSLDSRKVLTSPSLWTRQPPPRITLEVPLAGPVGSLAGELL